MEFLTAVTAVSARIPSFFSLLWYRICFFLMLSIYLSVQSEEVSYAQDCTTNTLLF